ncbi:hypothetical protein GCM10009715_36190 [Paeniglutamicibacter psychrophenolicus]|uniref:Squalene cyclase n=1 Tax=Paeniglutamicibacter psychrophenolicus TaxID=257454 RepID=A0ABS4WAH4_9MICC|nr:hypothetical protein [Paeniglutamicibacter psychrophenolicus]MBP2373205.1 hypothetical protein [Paeniglutamicibacter psychrophenolicus]
MDIATWLLDSDPSLRWQVMRDLLDRPEPEVARERARVALEGHGAQLLALQDARGYWNNDEYGEDQDRRSVFWSLALLRRLGADPADPGVRTAVERVHESVIWKYWDNLPFFHGEEEPCINGGVLSQGAYFGKTGEGSERITARLLAEQLPDGGWNCEAPDKSKVSSFDTTLCVLEGLLEHERAVGEVPAALAEARTRGEEYLLKRSGFKRLSTGEVANGRYLNFSFPPYWFYDVLRALDYFRDAGGTFDARLEPAIESLASRRGADGRWAAGVTWPGDVYLDVDAPESEPSRWNTLRALRVLRWSGVETQSQDVG